MHLLRMGSVIHIRFGLRVYGTSRKYVTNYFLVFWGLYFPGRLNYVYSCTVPFLGVPAASTWFTTIRLPERTRVMYIMMVLYVLTAGTYYPSYRGASL